MKASITSVSILLSLILSGCDLFQDPSSVKGEIQVLVKQFSEAAQTDVNGMLAMYEQSPGTVSIGNGEIQRGIEAIRKSADTDLVTTLGKFKYDLGSIEVTPLGRGYALAVTPFIITENSATPFARQLKGVSTLVWKKTTDGWKVVHEHDSLQPS